MTADGVESATSFRKRARSWIQGNLKPADADAREGVLRNDRSDEQELAEVAYDRELQRRLFDAGLAGICFPTAYGGQGLTPAHQLALNEELVGFESPMRFQSPTISPCAAVILDFGTEEQKLAHLPAILKGEELWMQFLSEPGGGSDVAGAQTTAVRDGDEWVLNGSKVWTTGAWWSDWGLCLARTNWDVPKHRGPLRLHAPHPPARHRGPPDRDAERDQGVLPGVPDRRPGAGHRPHRRGGRRLDRRRPLDVPRAPAQQLSPTSPSRRVTPTAASVRHRCSGWPVAAGTATTRGSATSSARPGCSS